MSNIAEAGRGRTGGQKAPGAIAEPNFRALFDVLPTAVYTTDADGVVTYFNRAAEELAGRTPRIGQDKWCVTWKLYRANGEPLPLDQCPMAEALKTGRPVRGVQVIAERPNGERMPLTPFPTPLFDANGALTGAVNLLVDISAVTRAEAAAARYAEEQAALYRFTDRLHRAETMSDLHGAALDAILAAVRCSGCSILLFDDCGVMQFVAARGLSSAYRKAVTGHTPWKPGERNAELFTIDDIEAAEIDDALKATIRNEGIGALAFVPLSVDGGVVGKFMVYFDAPHVFTPEELNLAMTIAHQLSFSIARTRGEASLRESEARYRAIIETTPECVKLVAPDGALLHMNSSGLAMVGADCFETLEGASIYDVIAPEHREAFKALNEAVCAGNRGSLEFDIIGLNGVRRHMETHAAPFRNPDGTTVQLAVTRDVSERKRAEERQRKSDAEFRALADNIHQFTWMTDATGWIYWYNKRWFDYTGTTLEQMQGWGWQRVHHPDHVDRVTAQFKKHIASGEPWEDTFPLRGKDGEYRWFLSRALPIRDERGHIVRWFGTNTDITERLVAEEVRQKFISIVENSGDAIVSKDLNGVITSWNKGAERLFGYKAEEIVGKSILTLIPPEYQSEEPGIIDRIRRGESLSHYETIRQRKNGERIHISLTVSPIKDALGRIVGASKIARDITERKRSEEQRTLLINELNHRVKNTLATVQSLAMQTLRASDDREGSLALFNSRIAALANAHDILTREHWAGADLWQVISQAMSPFRQGDRIAAKGPALRVTPRQALALSMALHELATNAVKYGALSNNTGRIAIDWRVEDGVLTLDWRESGGPPVTPPRRKGFGTRLIERGLSNDLGGEARILYHGTGLEARVSAPLED